MKNLFALRLHRHQLMTAPFALLRVLLPYGLFLLPLLTQAQSVALKPSEAGLRVEIDGRLFTEYVVKDTPRPFLYPIIGAAGESVVRNFPMKKGVPGEEKFQDHPHHRSLWFAHGKVNGIDFWGEFTVFGRQEHTGFGEVKAAGNQGSFLTRTKWVAPTGQAVLTDERRIVIIALAGGERTLDFNITLKATECDLVLGDTKEGTMALRLCPSLSLNSSKGFVDTGSSTGHAFNSAGDRDKDIWGKHANWVCYYGPDLKGNAVGVVIFSHPENFRSPTTWHARDYGLFAVNPFGLHDFEPDKPAGAGDYTIKRGGSLTLRYRFYFAKGQPTPAELDARFQAYARGK
ncbi:MAG: PmoA family protein [Verrucomicrobia bacterium]|nr:PmoA family protein [Verrucomicrobiota bacterium]